MGRLALPVALLLVLPLVASAAWTGGADPVPPAAVGPTPQGPPLREDGLTLVLTLGLTDRLQVHSVTSVAWHPRPGGLGASFLADDALEFRFRLGPGGVPWVPHLGLRLGAPRPPSHPTMASPEAVG